MDEEQSLLVGKEELEDLRNHRSLVLESLQQLLQRPWFTVYQVCLHISLLILFCSAIAGTAHDLRLESTSIFPELRTLRYIINDQRITGHSIHSAYSGPPRNETNHAWDELLQPLLFNVSAEELETVGLLESEPVRYAAGGYIASLGGYHDLHCLNKLRRWLYKETYLPQISTHERELYKEHLDHCLDMLRVSTMCSPDLSLYTFHWPKDPQATFLDATSKSSRTCIDWEQFSDWSWKRKIELAPTLLKPNRPGTQ